MAALNTTGMLRENMSGRLVLGVNELAEGETLEVLWREHWVTGRVKWCAWRVAYQLVMEGGYKIELVRGMQARRVLEDG